MSCALERQVTNKWIPVAIRKQRLTAAMRRKLDSGETVEVDGQALRRRDYAERRALAVALKQNL